MLRPGFIGRRSGSRCGSWRCPRPGRCAPRAGSAGSTRGAQRCEPPLSTRRGMRDPARRSAPRADSCAGRRRPARAGHAVPRLVVVARPLPRVADHVDQAVAVRGERADRRRADPALGPGVPVRERALPRVRQHGAAGVLLVPPREARAGQAAARRPLPLRLGGEPLARPIGVGGRVLEAERARPDAAAGRRRRAGAERLAPARAGLPPPPLPPVAQVDRARPWA